MFKRFIRLFANSFRMKPSFFICKVLVVFFDSFSVYITLMAPKWIISGILESDIHKVFLTIISVAIFGLVYALIKRWVYIVMKAWEESLNIEIIDRFLRRSCRFNLYEYSEKNFFDNYTLMLDKCCEINKKPMEISIGFLSSLLKIFIVSVVLYWVNGLIISVLIGCVVIQTLLQYVINKYEYKYKEMMVKSSRKMQFIYNIFCLPNYIRDFRFGEYKDFIFNKKQYYSNEFIGKIKKGLTPIRNLSFLQSVTSVFENFAVTLYFSFEVIKKRIGIDDFFVCINAYNMLSSSIKSFTDLYNSIYSNDLYARKYVSLGYLDHQPEVSGQIPIDAIHSIECQKLCFIYPNGAVPVLKNVTLKLERGQKLLIRGMNGSGKSTLLYILGMLYEPSEGSILYNGIDSKVLNKELVQSKVLFMFQNSSMYPFTIKDNIIINRDISSDEFDKFISINNKTLGERNIDEWLCRYITTQFSDDGVDVSGGEAQQIYILRSFALSKDVIIMDEPTNNLDDEKVKWLIGLIQEMRDIIFIIVSHDERLYHVCDYVAHLEKGHISFVQ